jgi:isopenicillin-N N-acyltransferase-like protein
MYRAELRGLPRQRGRAYGETFRQQISHHIDYFWHGISQGSGQEPKEFIRAWLNEVNFIPTIERWTPSLLEEVRGIGEGAGLDFETIFSWQLLDELGWYINYIFLPRQKELSADTMPDVTQCSSFGVSSLGGRPAILAQNWDSHIFLEGSQALLHIRYPGDELEIYSIAAIGRIGPFGLSSRGIGLCMNSLNEFVNYSPSGLPVVFLSRGVLEQPDYRSAVSFLQRAPHATGQAYAVGGQGEIRVYECSANQVCRYFPGGGLEWVVHTNHPLVNTDLRITQDKLDSQSQAFKSDRKEKEANSFTRFDNIYHRMAKASPSINIETIQNISCSHDSVPYPVCRHPKQDSIITTMFGMIMEFTEPPILQIAPGRPCESSFETLHFHNQ